MYKFKDLKFKKLECTDGSFICYEAVVKVAGDYCLEYDIVTNMKLQNIRNCYEVQFSCCSEHLDSDGFKVLKRVPDMDAAKIVCQTHYDKFMNQMIKNIMKNVVAVIES